MSGLTAFSNLNVLSPLLALALVGCGSSSDGPGPGSTPDAGSSADARPFDPPTPDAAAAVTDFSQPGPFTVTASDEVAQVKACTMNYTVYLPNNQADAPLMILGHGFERNRSNQAVLAQHVASYGIRVVTPSYCHLAADDSNHPLNGEHAAELAAQLAPNEGVLYAGHSAGGLAAFIAAAQDSNAVAVLGLDMVDNDSLAANANLSIPALGLVAGPGSCNSEGNGVASYESGWVARIPDSTHCTYEEPSNPLCTIFCGGNGEGRELIKTIAAGFAAWQLGLDPTGEQWASPSGSEWQRMLGSGELQAL